MLDRIRASIPALPPAEQRVAKLVLADPRAFASLPVVELAERSHVSKPTVVRFCRSVGYDGLTDFKRKLAGSVNEGVPFVHRSVDEDDKSGDIVVKLIDNAVSDGHVQVMSATMLTHGDCAVIISNSGHSRDLLDVAEIARRKLSLIHI